MDHKQCSKQELWSLIGTLSFTAKVVPAGCTYMYLQRMIVLSTSVAHLHDTVTLDTGFCLDIHWWQAFTTPWLARSLFLLPHCTAALNLDLYTDSSDSIGLRAYCQGNSFSGRWTPDLAKHSIQYKELS